MPRLSGCSHVLVVILQAHRRDAADMVQGNTNASDMDRIEISGLRVMTLVGVLSHEREAAQPLEFDIVLEGDLRDAGSSDDLVDTAHYGLVAERAAEIARDSKDELLERLVHRIAED